VTAIDIEKVGPDQPSWSLFGAFGWNTAAQLVPVVLQVFATPFVLMRLGADRYGLIALVTAGLGILANIDGGIGSSAQVYFARYCSSGRIAEAAKLFFTLSCILVTSTCLVSAIAFGGAPAIARLMHIKAAARPDAVFLIRTLTPLFLLSGLKGLAQSLNQARGKWRSVAIQASVGSAAYAVTVVAGVAVGMSIRAVVLGYAVQQAITLPFALVTAVRSIDRRHFALPGLAVLREFFAFSAAIQMTALSIVVNLQADTIIISVVAPIKAVGYYAIGANVAEQVRALPLNALSPVTNRLAAVLGCSGREEAAHEMRRLQSIWVTWTTGLVAIVVGVALFVMRAWLGPGTALAGIVVLVLCLGHLVNLWTGVLSAFVNLLGRARLEARYMLIGVIINVALTIPLAWIFGAVGVVTGTAVGEVVSSLYFVGLCRRVVGSDLGSVLKSIPIGRAVLTMVIAAALEVPIWMLHLPRPAGLIASCGPAAIGIIVFALTVLGVHDFPQRLRQGVKRGCRRGSPSKPSATAPGTEGAGSAG
jgi:O-antigen/teichoic acid export membrane protein